MTTPGAADRIATARSDLNAIRDDLIGQLRQERSRARGPLMRMLHDVDGMLTPGYPFASQAGQDRVVARILGGRRNGIFLDVGAYDGRTGSNSLYFETHLGWTGVLVEPVKQHREMAELWRRAPCLPYAVSDRDGEASFIAVTQGYTQMSGLAGPYDAGLLDRVRADPRHVEDRITVPTRTLNSICHEAGLSRIDFVSLDIEGGEQAAITAFDHERIRVDVWAIENNAGSSLIPALMRDRGYNLAEFCGVDDIYVRNDL
ncbi:methyltransferase, FkbM family [Loktanella fryxellensis]|uniref:Methyltransferase, FkbM family n=1 Tax=Loktanella fryxellensis TaxID=245187 RepID=A0A1H7ZPQ9_9RHOB|nr:FkbM family methyltransferase [Loktanella fryxellensis]SEM59854.1 methyltransferase, FkbM family [Loktanella fryxellensis]